MLQLSGGYAKITEKLIEESGLAEESAATILQAKTSYAKFREWQMKNENMKAKARSK